MRLASRLALTAVFLAMAGVASAGGPTIATPDSTAWDTAKWDATPTDGCSANNSTNEMCAVRRETPRKEREATKFMKYFVVVNVVYGAGQHGPAQLIMHNKQSHIPILYSASECRLTASLSRDTLAGNNPENTYTWACVEAPEGQVGETPGGPQMIGTYFAD
jgi:hypothetical protein